MLQALRERNGMASVTETLKPVQSSMFLAAGYDDTAWPAAVVVGELGDQPWGPITPPDLNLAGPQTAGIAGKVRVTYVPYHEPIVVSALKPNAKYAATIFDPVTGRTGKKISVRADRSGQRRFDPPAGHMHDWVLVVE